MRPSDARASAAAAKLPHILQGRNSRSGAIWFGGRSFAPCAGGALRDKAARNRPNKGDLGNIYFVNHRLKNYFNYIIDVSCTI